MNIYFVFEGKTEPVVYKQWFKILLPELSEVHTYDAVKANNYYYESDMGVPDCYNVTANAIQEINECPNYDYLVLFADADRSTVDEKTQEAKDKINEKLQSKLHKSLPYNCELKIIIQKVCIETWFLGNKRFFINNPNSPLLREYVEYFDTSTRNPEDMAGELSFTEPLFGYSTKALFHEGYLREIFKEHNLTRTSRDTPPSRHLVYKKSKPMEVQESHFLEQLLLRTQSNPDHLISFQIFLNFISYIKTRLIPS